MGIIAGKRMSAAVVLAALLLGIAFLGGCGDGEEDLLAVQGSGQGMFAEEIAGERISEEEGAEGEFEPLEGSPIETGTGFGKDVTEESGRNSAAGSEMEGLPGGSASVESPSSEEPPADVSITISAAGDCTLGGYKEQGYAYTFWETYDKAEDKGYFFANVKDIFEADDMTIVNLEGPLTRSEDFREGQIYSMRGEPEYAWLLPEAGIETVSMGNNHRLDCKEQGTEDTVEALQEAGVVYAYDRNVGIYETKGIRIGFVSVNEVSEGSVVEKYLQDGIASLQEQGVELILACCHWGVEREYYSEDYQKKLGRKCIDWGADLVLGCHAHVLQGIDQYQGKYIVYGLGNFCFGGNRSPSDMDTMIFQQTFTISPEGEVTCGEARVIPCSVSSVSSRNNFQPTPLEGTECARVLEKINEYSRDFQVQADENGVLSYTEQ